MKKYFLIISLFASLLLCACTREMIPADGTAQRTLLVDCSQAQKVCLNASLQTVWNAGDTVSLFLPGSTPNTCGLFRGPEGSQTGWISFDASSAVPGTTYALIPYRSGNGISGTVLSTVVPAVQTFRRGSYDPATAVLVGATDTTTISFRYATSILSLNLTSSSSAPLSIKSITLRSANGETIAGDLLVDMTDPSSPDVTLDAGGSSTIVLQGAGEENLCTLDYGESESFYFNVAPASLSGGYCFDVLLSTGEVRTVRNTIDRQLEPATLYLTESGISQMFSVVIDFDSITFTPAIPTSATTTDDSGVSHSFTNASDGKVYEITAGALTGGYYLAKPSGHKCLRFNAADSWLKLPVIPELRIVRIGIKVIQASSKTLSVSSTKIATGDLVPNTSYDTDVMKYSYVDMSVGQAAYITTTNVNTQLNRIELYFE